MAEFSFFNKINLGRAFEHNLGPGGMEFGGGGGEGSYKVTKNWKKLKEDRKTITEIISLAFFQNENFSNTSAK